MLLASYARRVKKYPAYPEPCKTPSSAESMQRPAAEQTTTSTNNSGSGDIHITPRKLADGSCNVDIQVAIERSNQIAEQANQLVERSNLITERVNQMVEKAIQPTERFNQLFERLNENLSQSNVLAKESKQPVENSETR